MKLTVYYYWGNSNQFVIKDETNHIFATVSRNPHEPPIPQTNEHGENTSHPAHLRARAIVEAFQDVENYKTQIVALENKINQLVTTQEDL